MKESLPESDEQLSLKKRARRRLIGAIVFVTFAAVVLPMVMDEEAPPASPNIELNIPVQEKGFVAPSTGAVKNAAVGIAEPVPVPAAPSAESKPVAEAPVASVAPAKAGTPAEVAKLSVEAKSEIKPKAVANLAVKATESKPAAKVAKPEVAKSEVAKSTMPAKPVADAQRAQSILEGKATEAASGNAGPHVILIGAFANAGNVQLLQKKLGEMGLKVYTEPLDSPQGKKTRVRVGPFANREAADKAAARMKAIGVGGVVAPKS